VATREERDVQELKERISRLVGDIRESDLHAVAMIVTGDPQEDLYILPARGGRYRTFSPKQLSQIGELMDAQGYTYDDGHWQRTLTAEEMAERDKGVEPLTAAEMISDEDRAPTVD
jgi:hypothetical protein